MEELRLLVSRQYKQAGAGYATSPHIWTITKLGLRVAHYGSDKLAMKLRYWSPRVAKHTLEHTLAINDVEIALKSLQNTPESEFRIDQIQHEPYCWQVFDNGIKSVKLKPDMYVETSRAIGDKRGKFRWWPEIDLATERPCQIIDKCQVYVDYWENVQPPILPTILLIVPDEFRQKQLREKIDQKFHKKSCIFEVIARSDLAITMTTWLPLRGQNV
jgi:hypothetical protein